MSIEPRRPIPDATAWAGVRTILVPPDILAVPRVSPVRIKKQTPWRQSPDGEPMARGGGREWFGDRVFVDADTTQLRAACGTSMTAHASCMIGLIVVLMTQPQPVPVGKVGPSLMMPVTLSMMPLAEAASPAPRSRERSAAKAAPPPPAAVPSETTAGGATAPVEAPSGIEPEAAVETSAAGTVAGGVEGGVDGGAPGGVAGGTVGGAPSGGGTPGPIRLGAGMEPPRKIKDVRPVYSQSAMVNRSRGTVVIEATVGVDGKVHDAVVIQSIPLLDQAALDAVRQWEFLPSRLNGVPVAVIVTIIVQFAIY